MKSFIPYFAVAAVLAAIIWAVSFGTLPPADFTFCNGDEIKTVDPAIVTGAPEGRIINALFEGLTRWNPKTLEPEPAVAASWDISDDKLTYTFHLRKNARWSDDTQVTADDFVWSWRRFLHPATGAEYAYELWYIVGAEEFTTGKIKSDFSSVGIKALDRQTLQVQLKHPVPYFLSLVGFYPMFPVNQRCVRKHGYPAWTKPENIVCNGPFRLKFRRIRDRIRLVKSDTYWDRDNVRLNVIDALAVSSSTTMLNLYMTGRADWITTVPVEVIPELMKRPEGDFTPSPFLAVYYYVVNTTKPPLDDKRVRQALALAIDKQQIVDKVARAGQQPARSLVPTEIRKYIDYIPAECGQYNIEEAGRLLAEAGYPGGRGMPKVEILYNTSENHKAIAELLQAQWKRALGVDVRLRNQEWTTYLNSRRQKKYQIARAGWIGDYVDPNTFLDMFVTDSPQNHTGWSNTEYDRLIDFAQQEPDEKKRLAYFHRAERILMDEMPVIPIYFYVSTSMVRSYVKGFYPNIQDVHPLRAIWIEGKGEGGRKSRN